METEIVALGNKKSSLIMRSEASVGSDCDCDAELLSSLIARLSHFGSF
jgi:hypothetical protein